MKTKNDLLVLGLSLVMPMGVSGALVVPGADDSDGVLHVTEDTVIDLSLATAGDGTTVGWDTPNGANAGNGVYDPAKWAVVFKYSSVTVDAGMTLSFKNHASRAPVVWLVSGDVTIAGTVSLNGGGWVAPPWLAEPGPGGYRGAAGYFASGVGAGAGLGPGGGQRNLAGSYSTAGGGGAPTYGNPSIVPLLGGSGGGGDDNSQMGGGGGGGALLVACSGTLTCSGAMTANGGAGRNGGGYPNYQRSGGGSGGSLRLICSSLAGEGLVRALAGGGYQTGGLGRLRIERVTADDTIAFSHDPSVVGLTDGDTALLWPPPTAPTVEVVSIGGLTPPEDPRAEFGSTGGDLQFPQTSSLAVVIQTMGVEEAAQVKIKRTPRTTNAAWIDAVVDEVVTADPLVIRWTADVPVGSGYGVMQVKVVRP